MGFLYVNGQGVEKDCAEGHKWLLLAAAQGDAPAKQILTDLEVQLTPEQRAEGQKRAGEFKLPAVAADLAQPSGTDGNLLPDLRAKVATGDAQAQNELGEALYSGKRGVTKNAVAAVKWFRKAAEKNYGVAQLNLGVCYERGEGVAKYEVEAYKWDLLAAAQGDSKAKRNASTLELLLSPEEIAEGKRRAQDWLEQRTKSSTKTPSI